MSATGFQRRRRLLQKRRQEAELQAANASGDTGGSGDRLLGEPKTGLAALSKKELLAYIGKKKLSDKQYKTLEPDAIIPLFLKTVQAKIVEAGLKTEIEAAAITEEELLDLLETLK